MPTYFKAIFHFDIKTNGLLSAMPYASQGISAVLFSYVADRLRRSDKLSITTIRKVWNTVGLVGPALCCLGIISVGCHAELIVALLCLGMFLNGFVYSGFNITHVDMSPDLAGVLYGITNSIANTAGIVSPMIVGVLTANGSVRFIKQEEISSEDKIFIALTRRPLKTGMQYFCITAAVYVASALFYAAFASAELQSWGKGKKA
ncbi:putative inorganic phosphate cotransporter [Caerostris extrusa]|uniref:Inorganic phosphate cotransporter n=1 Tax=Caerostris extrusa TaxID=172846 RepID=A0AAV4S5M6_CAEEX|nr:putative inorganic phosphate cotransporter [Caerostris extrusa]